MVKPSLYTTVECSRCSLCCRESIVPVTDSDVKRISRAIKKPAEQIVRFYSIDEMDYDPESGLWIRFTRGKRAMGLRKRHSRCIFLDNKNNCSIYNHRPMTCRTFPYVIDFDQDDKPRKVKLNQIVSCSCKRKKRTSLKEVIEDARVELKEDSRYYERIESWNRRKVPGRMRDFLRFLGLRVDG
jgi:Fe-S-cluster containining protein